MAHLDIIEATNEHWVSLNHGATILHNVCSCSIWNSHGSTSIKLISEIMNPIPVYISTDVSVLVK